MQKTKDQAIRTLLKYGGELGCSGRVCSSCSTYGTFGFAIIDGDQNKICNFFLTGLKIEGKICLDFSEPYERKL